MSSSSFSSPSSSCHIVYYSFDPTLSITVSPLSFTSSSHAQGLYRRSGQSSKISALYQNSLEKLKPTNFDDEDIETLSGVLKYALQQLTEPLFTFAQYDTFVNCGSECNIIPLCYNINAMTEIQERNDKLEAVIKELADLPEANFNTAQVLFAHLAKSACFTPT